MAPRLTTIATAIVAGTGALAGLAYVSGVGNGGAGGTGYVSLFNYGHEAPETIVPGPEVAAVLDTHPRQCLRVNALDTCNVVRAYERLGEDRFRVTTRTWDSGRIESGYERAYASWTVEMQVTPFGLCAEIDDLIAAYTPESDNAALAAELIRANTQGYRDPRVIADLHCDYYTALSYDEAADVWRTTSEEVYAETQFFGLLDTKIIAYASYNFSGRFAATEAPLAVMVDISTFD